MVENQRGVNSKLKYMVYKVKESCKMMKPLGDRVIVKVVEREEKTQSGILLPETAKEKPQMADVVAVGSGRLCESGTRVVPEVAVGDRVVFAKYSGTEVKVDGVDYLILSERDILAVLG